MRRHQAATASDYGCASPGEQIEIVDSFEFLKSSECPAPVVLEITDFLDRQNTSHPFQFPQWAGEGARFALSRRHGKLRWFALCGVSYPASRLLPPIRALTVNRGPVADDLDTMEIGLDRLVKTAALEGFTFVDIMPEWAGDFARAAENILARNDWKTTDAARTSLRLDLSGSLEELFAGFRKVTRYEIRRAEREQAAVKMASSAREHDDWCRMYSEMATTKHFAAGDLEHLRGVLHWLSGEPDRGGLLLAHRNGRLLGGAMIVRAGARCWYVLGATSKEDKFSAGHLLQWKALQWAREAGCREYDFGGFTPGAKGGPAFFKSGFCDNVVSFLPAHRFVISPNRYRTSEIVGHLRRKLRSAAKR